METQNTQIGCDARQPSLQALVLLKMVPPLMNCNRNVHPEVNDDGTQGHDTPWHPAPGVL